MVPDIIAIRNNTYIISKYKSIKAFRILECFFCMVISQFKRHSLFLGMLNYFIRIIPKFIYQPIKLILI